MAKKKKDPKAEPGLNPNQELFCRYYAQGEGTFGNATLSYAAAYEIGLGDPTLVDKDGNPLSAKLYPEEYNTCSANGSRLLRNDKVQERIRVLLNELLKDEIVDAELAKVIKQDGDLAPKVAAIKEFNKLRGRIIDKTQQINRLPFGENDLSTVIATLPQERQDYFYGIITSLIAEAELLRSGAKAESGGTR
jgi:hypothetical protein